MDKSSSFSSSVSKFPVLLALGAVFALGACDDGTGTGGGGTGGTGGGGTGGTPTGGGGTGGTSTGGGGTGGTSTTSSSSSSSTTTLTNTDVCPPDPTGAVPLLKLTQVFTGLDLPVYLTSAPGDPAHLFILEQSGRVRVAENGVLLDEPFLDLTGVVQPQAFQGDERGLLGIAFHPEYGQNGRFFVHYTDDDENHGVIVEHHATPGSAKADPAPVKTLYQVTETQYGNHNGGQIAFGPDGHLYIGFGDGGQSHDPDENAEDITSELGKILRVDVDTFPTPPPGNLPGGNPHVWDYGLRNPWRFSFDRCTGDLYIGDVGQGSWEEIDVEPKGQGHKNYGWDITEGNHCHEPLQGCDMTGITPAVAEYAHADGSGCSVTGGYVYRGYAIPNLVGTYFYADYCTRRVWTFRYEGGAAVDPQEVTSELDTANLLSISSFGEDAAGELYVVDHGGDIYRIDAD